MKRIALLTIEDLEGFVQDEYMVVEPLENRGFEVEWVPWRHPNVDWQVYDLAVIRTTWDYQQYPEEFFRVLKEIEAAGVRLANPSGVVQWNMDKSYLSELAGKGIPVVPTRKFEAPQKADLLDCFEYFGADELVIKPTISATAFDTYRFTKDVPEAFYAQMEELFRVRNCLVQPFMADIVREGEYSLVYFDGRFSHAFIKVAKEGDYRVQEEYGGAPHPVEPSRELREAAERVLAVIPGPLLYARVDLVRSGTEFLLMEVELIEPALYFRMDPDHAPGRFCDAVESWLSRA